MRNRSLCEKRFSIAFDRDFSGLVATAAGELTERSVLLVDMTRYDEERSLTFGYVPKGALATIDERQRTLLRTYNDQREFIISPYKPDGRTCTYLGQMPELGWWEALTLQTPYPPAKPGFPPPKAYQVAINWGLPALFTFAKVRSLLYDRRAQQSTGLG